MSACGWSLGSRESFAPTWKLIIITAFISSRPKNRNSPYIYPNLQNYIYTTATPYTTLIINSQKGSNVLHGEAYFEFPDTACALADLINFTRSVSDLRSVLKMR